MANPLEQLDWGNNVPDLSVPRKRDRPISFDAGSFHLSEGDGQFNWGEQFLNLSPAETDAVAGSWIPEHGNLGKNGGLVNNEGLESLSAESADNSEFLAGLQLQDELFGGGEGGIYEPYGGPAFEGPQAAYAQNQGTAKQTVHSQRSFEPNTNVYEWDLYNQNPETLAQLDGISAEEFLQQSGGALSLSPLVPSLPAGAPNQTTPVPLPHPALVASVRKPPPALVATGQKPPPALVATGRMPPQRPSKTLSNAEIQAAYTQSWGGQNLRKVPALVPQQESKEKQLGADREWTVDGAKTEAASIIRDLFRRPEAKRQAVTLEGGKVGFVEMKENTLVKPLNLRSNNAKPSPNPSTKPIKPSTQLSKPSPKPSPEPSGPARSSSAPSVSSGGSFSQPDRPPFYAQPPRAASASPDFSSEPFREEGIRAKPVTATMREIGSRIAQALSVETDESLPKYGSEGHGDVDGSGPSDLSTTAGLEWLLNEEPAARSGDKGGPPAGPSLHRLWAELPVPQLEAADFRTFRTLYKEELRGLRCWTATFVGKGLLPSIPELHYVICNALPGQHQRQARMMFTKGVLWGAYVSKTLDGASPCDLYYVRHDSQREFKEGPLQKLANLSKGMQHKVLNIVYVMEDLKDEATYGPELYRTYGALHKSGGVGLPPPVRGHAYHQISFPELTSLKAPANEEPASDDDVAIIKFEESPLFNPSTLLPNGHLAPWGSFWYNKKRLLATGKGLTHAGERGRQLVQNLAMQTLTAHVARYDCLASGGMPTLEKYLQFARYDLGISTGLGLAFCAIGQGLADEGWWEPSADVLNGLFADVGRALALTSQVFRVMSDLRTYQDDLVHCRLNAVAIRMREALCSHQEAIDFLTAKAASDVEALESEILSHASKDRFLSKCWQLAFDVCRMSVASFTYTGHEQRVNCLFSVP